jgi:DNA-directed RNA polymerase specialized sigma24 family protein
LKLCADRCERLYQFALKHPQAVEAYVRTIAMNVANDYFKAEWTRKRGGGHVVQLPDTIEPKAEDSSSGGLQSIQRDVLVHEIEVCLADCTKGRTQNRDQLIFRLHYRVGMSAEEIASLSTLGLSIKGVESVLHRLTQAVRRRLAKPPDLGGERPDSGPEGLGPVNSPNRTARGQDGAYPFIPGQ